MTDTLSLPKNGEGFEIKRSLRSRIRIAGALAVGALFGAAGMGIGMVKHGDSRFEAGYEQGIEDGRVQIAGLGIVRNESGRAVLRALGMQDGELTAPTISLDETWQCFSPGKKNEGSLCAQDEIGAGVQADTDAGVLRVLVAGKTFEGKLAEPERIANKYDEKECKNVMSQWSVRAQELYGQQRTADKSLPYISKVELVDVTAAQKMERISC